MILGHEHKGEEPGVRGGNTRVNLPNLSIKLMVLNRDSVHSPLRFDFRACWQDFSLYSLELLKTVSFFCCFNIQALTLNPQEVQNVYFKVTVDSNVALPQGGNNTLQEDILNYLQPSHVFFLFYFLIHFATREHTFTLCRLFIGCNTYCFTAFHIVRRCNPRNS